MDGLSTLLTKETDTKHMSKGCNKLHTGMRG